MKISKGMYIRYKYYNEQKIGKIDFIKQDELLDENLIGLINDERVLEGNIVKASFNIVDLIEVGDYVNGVEVEDINDKELMLADTHLWIDKEVANRLIETIITKEQFNFMKYVVERNTNENL